MAPSDRLESGHLGGFFVGALIGAGIALLFAPQAGAQLRRFLRDSAACATEELQETVDHGAEVLDHSVAQGKEFVEKGKESIREAGRHAKEFVDAGRTSFKETKDELASRR